MIAVPPEQAQTTHARVNHANNGRRGSKTNASTASATDSAGEHKYRKTKSTDRHAQDSLAAQLAKPFPVAKAVLYTLVFAPLALLSGSFSLAVSLDTQEPQISQRVFGELPEAKRRLGDLTIAEEMERLVENKPFTQSTNLTPEDLAKTEGEFPRSAAQIAALFPAQARTDIAAFARSALENTSLSSGALRQLALIEINPSKRRNLLDLSYAVSRRDLSAAAQTAEIQLRSGELSEGLATLNRALAISDRLDETIFPILLSATRVQDFDTLLRPVLAADPIWAQRLAEHASVDARSAPLFAGLVDAFPEGSPARSLDYGSRLVDQLAADLQLSAVFQAYETYSTHPQDPTAFRMRPLTPLDWQLIDNLDSGIRLVGSRDKAVELFARPRRSDEVSRILMRLPPGLYSLSFSIVDPRGEGGTFMLTRTCLDDDRELETYLDERSLDTKRVSFVFAVPEGCPYQSVRLGVEAGPEALSVLLEDASFETLSEDGNQARVEL